ncbi:MAG: amidohydrolase family protein [Chloroflexota bacterium]
MIIDTHTHFYDPARPQGVPWPPKDNALLYRPVFPTHYKDLAESEGVTGTVVVEASAWFEDNQWILDLATEDPFLVGLVGHIDPNQPQFGEQLAQFAAHPLFLGIRCGGHFFEDVNRGSFLSDLKLLIEHDLQLDVLLRKENFSGLFKVAEKLPDLRIVVDHIAHMPIDGEAVPLSWLDFYKRMSRYPNIYLKVSAVLEQSVIQPAPTDLDYYRPSLDAIWGAFGENRVIYGSNWPVCERASTFVDSLNLMKTYLSEKGPSAREKYFWQNSKAVYKWVGQHLSA